MQGFGSILLILYICFVFGITLFLLILFWRFIRAHERMADSLSLIARKLRDDGKA